MFALYLITTIITAFALPAVIDITKKQLKRRQTRTYFRKWDESHNPKTR